MIQDRLFESDFDRFIQLEKEASQIRLGESAEDIWIKTPERTNMTQQKPIVATQNAHYLKGHASWLYCDNCNKTIAYLCYVTYQYFRFDFTCLCGCAGFAENRCSDIDMSSLPTGELVRSTANKRFCCSIDESPLFSPVPKNLKSYNAEIVCKECSVRYSTNEIF